MRDSYGKAGGWRLVSAALGGGHGIIDPARPDQGLAGRSMRVDARHRHQVEQALDREQRALADLLPAICSNVGLARDLETSCPIEAQQTKKAKVERAARFPVEDEGVQKARQQATQRQAGRLVDFLPDMAHQHLKEDLVPPFVDQMLAQGDMKSRILRCVL